MSLRTLVLIALVSFASQVLAHDSRPNFIEIIESSQCRVADDRHA
jgi:hypothetical protein